MHTTEWKRTWNEDIEFGRKREWAMPSIEPSKSFVEMRYPASDEHDAREITLDTDEDSKETLLEPKKVSHLPIPS
jgi:hypothetical protein